MNLSRKDAIAALDPLKEGLTVKKAQSYSHIWFDKTYAYATNGGYGVRTKFKSDLECGVPGALLLGMLNQAASDTIEFTAEDNALKFKVGRSSVKLVTMPLESRVWRYPEKPTGKPLATIKITESFIKALKYVMVLRPTKPKRMEHYGICVYAVEQEMDICITDSNNLTIMSVAEPIVGAAKKLVIPRSLAEQIVELCVPGKELKMYATHFVVEATDKITLYSVVFDTSEMLNLSKDADKFADNKKAPPFAIPEGWDILLEKTTTLAGSEDPMVEVKSLGKALKVSGHFKYGDIDEEFDIAKVVPKVAVYVNAKRLAGVSGIKKLAIYEGRALSLLGEDGFMYVLGGQASAKEVTAKSARKGRQKDTSGDDDE